MEDICIMCHEPLHKHVKIYAGLGHLCCSKQCAVNHIIQELDVEQIAEYALDGCFEEISPEDIGIYDDGDDYDDCDVVQCDWCKEDMDESEVRRTDLGMLCDHCILAIISRGEEVIVYE